MSVTLSDLLEWRSQLPESSHDEANMLNALIARRETEIRARIADLIASTSQRENWKLQHCAAVARRVEHTPVSQLELLHKFFQCREQGQQHVETPAALSDLFAIDRPESEAPRAPVQAVAAEAREPVVPLPVADLHGVMGSLESRVASTPGISAGIQGVRIMRMVALMSKARAAQIAKMRMDGTQAFYRHS
ncbi:hypothetical protein AWB76_02763 [Caballeronia temeraria]|uniref:Uncharacterized protein n=1 Tax=Caballeronia temeraria TaxID=1777137 RepID=A0A158AP31_9BURK|nr:hypothetical protein [Caballeronia temeraria]SAK59505.1 hypothetical protein AWB76_02763 [Caballeronia temeraria]